MIFCLVVKTVVVFILVDGLVRIVVVVTGLGVLLPLGLDVINRTSPATAGPLIDVNPLKVCAVGLGVGRFADFPFLCCPRTLFFLCD